MSTRIVALVLSLSGDPDSLDVLTKDLRRAGTDPYVVPTGRSLEESLSASEIPYVSIRSNPGFGEALVRAQAQVGPWDFILFVNDDVTIDPVSLEAELATWAPVAAGSLHYLDPVPVKPIPTTWRTLLMVSLWNVVLGRWVSPRAPQPTAAEPIDGGKWFRPFSIVGVSHNLWTALGGFDSRLTYTFEDADFGRRAAARGAKVYFNSPSGIKHERSSTSKRYAEVVLPVANWSAAMYLVTLGVSPRRARILCAGACLARVPLVLGAPLPKMPHLRGIWRSLRHLIRGEAPSLPEYGDV